MKKGKYSLVAVAVLFFSFIMAFFPVNSAYAMYQFNCSQPGQNCGGVYIEDFDKSAYTIKLWYTAGQTLNQIVTNENSSYHAITFYVVGPNGFQTDTHVAPINSIKSFEFTAPYTGYYQLFLYCDYGNAWDCEGLGKLTNM